MIIFVAAQAPELVSRDLRSHVLPLYFCRPLRRMDYPLAKLIAFITACLAHDRDPAAAALPGHDHPVARAAARSGIRPRRCIPGLLVGLLWAVLLAAIGLALASLTGRRAYATGAIAIYFFLTWILAGLLDNIGGGGNHGPLTGGVGTAAAGARLSGLVSPFTTLDGVRQWLGGTSRGPIPPRATTARCTE